MQFQVFPIVVLKSFTRLYFLFATCLDFGTMPKRRSPFQVLKYFAKKNLLFLKYLLFSLKSEPFFELKWHIKVQKGDQIQRIKRSRKK